MTDHVISNNLVVLGMSTFTGGQTFDGQAVIDIDSTEALLVREDGDTGDVFIVNTVTASATLPHVNSFISLGPNTAASGDIRFANTRFIAWRNMNNNGDVQALSVDEDDFLNIGSAAALQARILSPSFVALQVGPHSIGTSPPQNHRQLRLAGNFISGGQSTSATNFHMETDLTGFSGDTTFLAGFAYQGAITTQAVAEVIANVSSMQLDEPAITLGAGSSVTNAQTLLITGAPTEGVSNDALRVADGRIFFGGQLIVDHDSTASFQVRKDGDAGDVFNVNTVSDIVTVEGGLKVEGTVASSFGSPPPMVITSAFTIDTTFTAGINGTASHALDFFPSFTGATGNTTALSLLSLAGNISTQTATESIANISTMVLNEPSITDNLTGDITNAQSLLITGAPTEGESNYAQRILGGDFQLANSSAILFRNGSNTLDFTALAVAPTDFLEIGGAGSPEFERVNIRSLGRISLFPTDEVQIRTDNSSAFRISTVGNVALFQVLQTQTRVVGSLVVADSIANNSAETEIQSTFADVATSAGSSVTAASLIPAGSFVIGVTVRVLATVLGPASFDVGDGTDVDRWGASIAISQLTTTDITDFTTSALTTFPLANDVVLTSTGVDFTSGSVRITVHYMTLQTSAA